MVRRQIEFPKTHDLDELLDLVSKVDGSLAESLRETTILTDYGATIRYPDDLSNMTLEDAKRAVSLAAKVREATRKVLADPSKKNR